jgi:hypothetical protein
MGLKSAVQKLALRTLEHLTPKSQEDSWADLKKEELQAKIERGGAPAPTAGATTETGAPKPFYRKDGQIHNFNALPFPGHKRKRLTAAQHEARLGGARPSPKHNVGWIAKAAPQPEPSTEVASASVESRMFQCYSDDCCCPDQGCLED